jgi:hypothetical protein
MIRILSVILISLLLGGVLACGATAWPLRPGLIGLAAMVLAALAARNYWLGLRLAAPGSPERALWLGLGSASVIVGHLVASLWRIGPAMELHTRAGHALGTDIWTLVLGSAIAYSIARDPEPRHDERDAQIAARGLSAGYWSLVGILLVLILWLGFGADRAMPALSFAMIAHLLITAVIASRLVCDGVQLHAYGRDRSIEERES